MVTREIVIGDHSGANASPAAMLVQLASKFESSIHVDQAEKRTNAKSIMGMMTLVLNNGEELIVTAEGDDEELAVDNIEKFLTGK